MSTYFQGSLRAAAWQALTPSEQSAAVDAACRWLRTLCFDPLAVCCGDENSRTEVELLADFALAWEMAFSELALMLFQHPDALVSGPPTTGGGGGGGGAAAGTFTKRQKLGDLEVEYDQFSSSTAAAAATTSAGDPRLTNAPKILRTFPWLYDILHCYLRRVGGTSRILYRVRS